MRGLEWRQPIGCSFFLKIVHLNLSTVLNCTFLCNYSGVKSNLLTLPFPLLPLCQAAPPTPFPSAPPPLNPLFRF